MNREPRQSGFMLLELVVVLAVIGVLVGAAVPLASAIIDGGRRQDVQRELTTIADALQAYYYDHAAFPPALNDPTFLRSYMPASVGDTGVIDGWGPDQFYVYAVNAAANVATVHSRGEDAIDQGIANERSSVRVYGAVPGLARTRQRMQVIHAAIARFLAGSGSLTGVWSTDRVAIGLGGEYQRDGLGTDFVLTVTPLSLRSAGADRVHGTPDDLTD